MVDYVGKTTDDIAALTLEQKLSIDTQISVLNEILDVAKDIKARVKDCKDLLIDIKALQD
jgi:hypothetical protein